MGTARKSSLQIANLLAKLQNKAKTSKTDNPIDQIVKGTEGYYIIFSGKKIFKTINIDDEGLQNIKDLVNNKINLTDTNYFLQVQLNDIKNDISNIEILNVYPEYNGIRRVLDGSNNEIIVGIKPGEIDNLTSSIPGEDKQYIKKVNHLFVADDVMRLLNTNDENIVQAELEMMKKFENTRNVDVDEHLASDFIQDSKVTKSEVLTYNSITLEGDPIIYGNYTYKQYKITDSKNENHYIIYQIENSNPENIKEVYQSHTKRSFIDVNGATLVINDYVFADNVLNSNEECFLIYPTGETKRSPIKLNNDMGIYGDYTYREYVIDALSWCYTVLGWKTSDPYNQHVVIRSDSWIFNDTITNVGMLLCDNRRIGNNDSYTSKVVNTSGTVYAATVTQRNTFTYGTTYTYRQYSITANSKTEYVMYQILTKTPTTFTNILMSDSWIFNDTITNVGMLLCDNRRIGNNDSYTSKVVYEDGKEYSVSISHSNIPTLVIVSLNIHESLIRIFLNDEVSAVFI